MVEVLCHMCMGARPLQSRIPAAGTGSTGAGASWQLGWIGTTAAERAGFAIFCL